MNGEETRRLNVESRKVQERKFRGFPRAQNPTFCKCNTQRNLELKHSETSFRSYVLNHGPFFWRFSGLMRMS